MRGDQRHIGLRVVLLEHAVEREDGRRAHHGGIAAHGGERGAQVVDHVVDLLLAGDHEHMAARRLPEQAAQPIGLVLGE